MLISELVTALEAIKAAHGDVIVMHHDDWTEFLVEQVTFKPPAGDSTWQEPAHVLLTGEARDFDGRGGLREPPEPLSDVAARLGLCTETLAWIQLTPGSLTAQGLLTDPMGNALNHERLEAIKCGITSDSDEMRERMATVKATLDQYLKDRAKGV